MLDYLGSKSELNGGLPDGLGCDSLWEQGQQDKELHIKDDQTFLSPEFSAHRRMAYPCGRGCSLPGMTLVDKGCIRASSWDTKST